jgi:hypothetical protein
MAKWVRCKYVNEVGLEVGLTFSYGSKKVRDDIFFRYRLSKENVTMYNIYEGDELIYSLEGTAPMQKP